METTKKQMKDLIDAIEILKVQKGDAIILKVNGRLSETAHIRIKEYLKKVLAIMGKKNIPIVILEDGLDIEILRLKDGTKTGNSE